MKLILATAFALVTAVFADINCVVNYNATWKPDEMHACVNQYRAGSWGDMICAELGWVQSGTKGYAPGDCTAACASCLDQAIDNGAIDTLCTDQIGGEMCNFGFH